MRDMWISQHSHFSSFVFTKKTKTKQNNQKKQTAEMLLGRGENVPTLWMTTQSIWPLKSRLQTQPSIQSSVRKAPRPQEPFCPQENLHDILLLLLLFYFIFYVPRSCLLFSLHLSHFHIYFQTSGPFVQTLADLSLNVSFTLGSSHYSSDSSSAPSISFLKLFCFHTCGEP